MSTYRITVRTQADRDVDSALAWYEGQRAELAVDFLLELRATFDRIADGPLRYRVVRSGVRRIMLRRFPYAVFYEVDGDAILIVAVQHTSRNPGTWQQRLR